MFKYRLVQMEDDTYVVQRDDVFRWEEVFRSYSLEGATRALGDLRYLEKKSNSKDIIRRILDV